jgi:hypothetical protein
LKQNYHLLIGGTADADLFLAPTLVAQVVFQQQTLNRAEDAKMVASSNSLPSKPMLQFIFNYKSPFFLFQTEMDATKSISNDVNRKKECN